MKKYSENRCADWSFSGGAFNEYMEPLLELKKVDKVFPGRELLSFRGQQGGTNAGKGL